VGGRIGKDFDAGQQIAIQVVEVRQARQVDEIFLVEISDSFRVCLAMRKTSSRSSV